MIGEIGTMSEVVSPPPPRPCDAAEDTDAAARRWLTAAAGVDVLAKLAGLRDKFRATDNDRLAAQDRVRRGGRLGRDSALYEMERLTQEQQLQRAAVGLLDKELRELAFLCRAPGSDQGPNRGA